MYIKYACRCEGVSEIDNITRNPWEFDWQPRSEWFSYEQKNKDYIVFKKKTREDFIQFIPAGIIPNLMDGFLGLNTVPRIDVALSSAPCNKTPLRISLNIPSPPTEIMLKQSKGIVWNGNNKD